MKESLSIFLLSRCPAGVPTSSSRGHSIQNLYHCLTNSISQYTPCLGTDFIHSWFQSGVLFKTYTHHIAKSCSTVIGHYWVFALPCLALPCLALPCLALPCLALPCLALPCLCFGLWTVLVSWLFAACLDHYLCFCLFFCPCHSPLYTYI